MLHIDQTELTAVVGGTSRTNNDQITQQLTSLQTSLQGLSSNNNSGSSNNTFMMLAMMMAMRPSPTVVAGGPPPVAAVAAPAPIAAGPVVNINTRVRHW